MSGLGRAFMAGLASAATPVQGPEHYREIANYELQRKYVTGEDGLLEDDFDGDLYQALRDLGKVCADDSLDRDTVMLAVDAFRNAVNREAARYAGPREWELACQMAEEE